MKNIYFFIGTEAELIKVFPVIIECQNSGNICHIIASGQNDLNKSRIVKNIQLNGKYVELSKEEDIKKSANGLLSWFITTKRKAIAIIRQNFDIQMMKDAPFVVHGDTVSTYMGAMIGKKLGCIVCHVEAGLRSHNLLNPFPEEIDRLLTSRIARVHFAPGEEPVKNLKKVKGKVISTEYNTILDSLNYSKSISVESKEVSHLLEQNYFVFVMHRQENLMNKEFFEGVLEKIGQLSERKKCVLILHKITENALQQMGKLQELQTNKNFILLPRVDYFDFMKLLQTAQFVITDGGSNQEELHYMGKPCLIMRKTTERNEGIGQNAILFKGNMEQINEFGKQYRKYQCKPVSVEKSPSQIIALFLKAIPERKSNGY